MPVQKRSFPSYLVGDASPRSSVWIVRTRYPFIMSRCERVRLNDLRLHCGPAPARNSPRIEKIVTTMAEIWARDVEKLPAFPPKWDFVFRQEFQPPPFLFAGSHRSNFACVLHCLPPRFMLVLDDHHCPTDQIIALDKLEQTEKLERAALKFLRHYTREEDELRKFFGR